MRRDTNNNPLLLAGATPGGEYRIVEMKYTGYAVQDMEDDYVHDERFDLRAEAEEWIEKQRYKVN